MPSVYDYALEEFKRWSPEILTRFTKSPNGRQVYNNDPIDEYSPVLIVEFPLVYVRAETFSSIFLMLCNEDFWDKKWGELEASGLDVVDAILTVQDNPLLSAISYVDISHVWENGMSDLEGYLIDILPSAGYCHMLRTFPTYLGMVKGYRERPETLANDMLVSFEDISGIGQVRQMTIKDVVEGSNG